MTTTERETGRRRRAGFRCAVAVVATALAGALGRDLGAQPTSPRFRTWGLGDGMAHDAVYAVHQDRSGLIWVGTQAGLLRFDGETFEPFLHRAEDPSSLSDDHVLALHDDGQGSLWVGTFQGWLDRIDLASNRVERIAPPAGVPSGVGAPTVHAIATLRTGELALATDLGALAFDRGARTYRGLDPRATNGRRESATALLVESDGVVWIGYGSGALRRLSAPDGSDAETVGELGAEISAIARGPGDSLWVGTRGAGVLVLEPMGHAVAGRLHAAAHAQRRIAHDRVQDLTFDHDGDLWVAGLAGVDVVAADGGSTRHYTANDADPWSLPHPLVFAVLADSQGVVWVGTSGGLGRVHPHDKAFTRLQGRNALQDGIAGGGVLALAPAGPGRLWVGTYGAGLDRIDLDDGSVAHWPAAADPRAPSGGEVKALAVDPGGSLWIATMGGGVNRLDPLSTEFVRVPVRASGPGVDASFVTSITVDAAGSIWAGTLRDGLHRYDDQAGEFRRFRGVDGKLDLGSDYVWPVVEDADRNLWVGAFEGGLTKIGSDRRSAVSYRVGSSGLPSDLITTLFVGAGRTLWIGTEGAGVIRFDPESERFEQLTTAQGLPHNNVQALLTDRDGAVWISTNAGLARVDGDDAITTFSQETGLHGSRFYANAALALEDGRLAFGGQGGLTLVDPRMLRPTASPSRVVLTGFSVGGERRPTPPSGSTEAIDLGPRENFFAFRFAAIDYADPASVEYRYKLEPLDEEWIENGNAKLANYTSVPPDSYRFLVEARNSFGVWSDQPLALSLVVHPPFHATLWFRALVLAAVASLLTAAYLYRMRQLVQLHDLRFHIAGKLHDEIASNLGTIALRTADLEKSARRLKGRAGDPQVLDGLATELGKVSRIASEATHAVRETVWVVNTKYDTVAGLCGKLRDTADTLLPSSVERSLTGTVDPPNHAINMGMRRNVYLIFKEALHNIEGHAEATRVAIDVSYAKPNLVITIEDDGKGFDPQQCETRGNGLGLMRTRAEKVGASLSIESVIGEGTRVVLKARVH